MNQNVCQFLMAYSRNSLQYQIFSKQTVDESHNHLAVSAATHVQGK